MSVMTIYRAFVQNQVYELKNKHDSTNPMCLGLDPWLTHVHSFPSAYLNAPLPQDADWLDRHNPWIPYRHRMRPRPSTGIPHRQRTIRAPRLRTDLLPTLQDRPLRRRVHHVSLRHLPLLAHHTNWNDIHNRVCRRSVYFQQLTSQHRQSNYQHRKTLWSDARPRSNQLPRTTSCTQHQQNRYDNSAKTTGQTVFTASTTKGNHPYSLPLPKDNDPTPQPADHYAYLRLLGILLYLTKSRPDIMAAVSFAGTKSSNPTDRNLRDLYYVVEYLRATQDMGNILHKSTTHALRIYCEVDASYLLHPDSKGHSGYTISFHGTTGTFHNRSVKQTAVATSSTHAEARAIFTLAKELNFLIALNHYAPPHFGLWLTRSLASRLLSRSSTHYPIIGRKSIVHQYGYIVLSTAQRKKATSTWRARRIYRCQASANALPAVPPSSSTGTDSGGRRTQTGHDRKQKLTAASTHTTLSPITHCTVNNDVFYTRTALYKKPLR